MNAERRGGVRNSFLISRESLLNVKLLELFERFIEKNVAIEHLFDDSFKAGANLHLFALDSETLSGHQFVGFEIARRGCLGDFGRQFGARRLLVPFDTFQIIAHVLFVE